MNSSRETSRVLLLAADASPFWSSRAAGDGIVALAQQLRKQGIDARIAIPQQQNWQSDPAADTEVIASLLVPMDHHHELASIHTIQLGQVPTYLVGNPGYFGRDRSYLQVDEAERYIFFSRAVLEMLPRPEIAWQPDVLHCFGWQTGIVPNWLRTTYRGKPFYAQTACVYTLHSLTDQGICGYRILELAGLSAYGFIQHAGIGELSELVDLLARGIYYADAICASSEHYAAEILTPEYGEHLDPLLRERRERLYGVLHGIDTERYDPATDTSLAARYDIDSLDRRQLNKSALQRELGLEERADTALLALLSDLHADKGLDLLLPVLDQVLQQLDTQIVVMAAGEERYQRALRERARGYPGCVALRFSPDEGLERRIYAGSDLLLAPSLFEPSGCVHLLALRYGCVPIVRATGSLADAISDYDPRSDAGNGFCFELADSWALYTAIVRAVEAHKHAESWHALQSRCLAADVSWASAARHYAAIYDAALAQPHQSA